MMIGQYCALQIASEHDQRSNRIVAVSHGNDMLQTRLRFDVFTGILYQKN